MRMIRPQRFNHSLRRAVRRHRRPGVQIRVYLNTDSAAAQHGYRPGTPLTLAYHYLLPSNGPCGDDSLIARVFATFTDRPEFDVDRTHSHTWRTLGLRPLSTGDVVAVDDRCYTRRSEGWTPLPC